MRKIILYTISLLLFVTSCNVLDTEDRGSYGPDDVWNDEKLSNAYLVDLYQRTFSGWPATEKDWGDDVMGIVGPDAVTIIEGGNRPWQYESIREINILLENIDKGTLTEEQWKPLKGQALFLRAYNYFLMLRVYGGIPYIKVAQSKDDPDLKVKRNTSEECFQYIMEDLDEAILLIPEAKYRDSNYGRIDQSACKAFKGRVALLKASPQFNPKDPYGNKYWQEALTITAEAHQFLQNNGFGLVDNYDDIFMTEGHNEAVLAVIYQNPSKLNGRFEHGIRPLTQSKDHTSIDQPTWGLAQAYPMKDGKKITESAMYNEQTFWKDRDPRFYATLVSNGELYELGGQVGRRQYTAPGIADPLDAFGIKSSMVQYDRTGLYCRKGLVVKNTADQAQLNDVDWLEIRYAEVLFNHAEAANENGNTSVGYDVLKQIRQRAGIEAGSDGLFGIKKNMSREEMRQALLDEKRIEFSFEGQRFWDLRRHRLLHSFLHGQRKYGILASLKSHISLDEGVRLAKDNLLLPEDFDYTPLDLANLNPTQYPTMYYPENYYFYPIQRSQIELNSNLEQTIGWDSGTFDPTLK